MEALKNILNNFLKLENGTVLFFTMDKNPFLQDLVAELNTKGQLYAGLLADGGQLPDYSKASVKFFGKNPGPIRLFDSGDFWKSWNIELTLNGFFIDADGEKPDGTNLFRKYSEYGEILGLTDKNTQIFIEQLIPQVIHEIIAIL
jgi:hypothetical protein